MLIVVTAFMLLMGGFGAILAGQPITRAIALEKQGSLETQEGRAKQGVIAASDEVVNIAHATAISVTLLLPTQSGARYTLTVPVDLDLDIAVSGEETDILQLLQQGIPVLNVSELAEPQVVLVTNADLLPTPTPDPVAGLPHVTTNVNLRQGPDTSFPIAGQVRPGDTFTIFARNPDNTWYQVQMLDGTIGWMAAYLIRGRIEEAELEVVPGMSALIPTPTPAPEENRP